MQGPDYKEYINSPEWKERRAQALHYADGRCQICYAKKNLHVHHRTYERFGNERAADLTVLCLDCHNLFHQSFDREYGRFVRNKKPKPKNKQRGKMSEPTPMPFGVDGKIDCPWCGKNMRPDLQQGRKAAKVHCSACRKFIRKIGTQRAVAFSRPTRKAATA